MSGEGGGWRGSERCMPPVGALVIEPRHFQIAVRIPILSKSLPYTLRFMELGGVWAKRFLVKGSGDQNDVA